MLTSREEQVLQVVRAGVARRGYPPSIREIGDAVGLRSTSSVAYHLKALEKKGYVHRDPGRPRTMELLPPESFAPDMVVMDNGPVLALCRPEPAPPRARAGRGHVRYPVSGAGLRAVGRSHRRRWPDPGQAADRGHVPAAQAAGR